jgi:hypothetical protein
MAAPILSITKLSENDRYVILRANIGEGATVDASNLVLATASDYTTILTAYSLSINRVWYSLDGFSVNLKFEADTPDKAITLTGNGSYDLAEIDGIKNPGTAGSTGNILLDTIGIADTGNPGSIIIEMRKVLEDESGGDLDAAGSSSTFTPEVPEVSGGIIIGGNSAAAGYISLKEDSDNGTNKLTIQAPASIASDFVLTMPADDGDANQVLGTDGSGTLDWVTVTTAGSIGTDIQAYSPDLDDLVDRWNMATTGGPSSLEFQEDTDNGTNKITVSAPASIASDVAITLPGADGTVLTDTDIGSSVQGYDSDLDDLISQWVPNEAQASSLTFKERSTNGTQGITVIAPTALTANYVMTLPQTTGTFLASTDIGSSVQAYSANLADLATNYTAASASGAASLKLYEDTDNGTDSITIQAPATLAGDVTLTLPTTDGDADQVLKTDGSGNLSWVAQSGGGLDEWTAASGSGGSLLKFYEDTDGGTNYIALQGPDTAAADVTFKLPVADGTTGQILKTDGSGQLGWVDNTAGESEETGFWTPGYMSQGGEDSITYDAGSWVPKGHYRKIGSVVTCVFELATDSWSGASGSYIYLTGLPYTPLKASAVGGEGNNTTFGSLMPYLWTTAGPTIIQYQSTNAYLVYISAGSYTYITPSNITSGANSNGLFGTLVYTTSS